MVDDEQTIAGLPRKPGTGRTGRPRAFDKGVALRKAMHVFWKRGYEGASIPLLTEAMGIRSPSLYAAFGDKRSLLNQAVDLYLEEEGAVSLAAMDSAAHPRACLEAMLRNSIDMLTGSVQSRGCFVVLGTFHTGDAEIDRMMASKRGQIRDAVRSLLERAEEEGVALPAPPRQLELLYTTFLHGLSIRIYDGESREELHGAVDALLAGWQPRNAEITTAAEPLRSPVHEH
jgi:AcrR family transcriptional regulator